MKRSPSPGTEAPAARGTSPAARGTRHRATEGPFIESVGPAGDAFERAADRIANAVVRGDLTAPARADWAAASTGGAIQRKCAACDCPECRKKEEERIRRSPAETEAADQEMPAPAEQTPAEAGVEPEEQAPAAASPDVAPAPALLVDDEAEVDRGQMRKGEFLAALRVEVCSAADQALAGTGRTTEGCPWIDYWLGYYEGQDATHIERALRRYAPEAAGAASAREYIGIATARVTRSVAVWANTGEITGVPEDVPGAGVLDTTGGMFFKARPGGARRANPVSVRHALGSGQTLPGSVRSRMESAFGTDFSGVPLHTDATGNRLSNELNARAFTVGQHVAFGPGEFRPGTIAGDALIAHELAHVVQQGAAAGPVPMAKAPESSGPLETDADRSAVSAVASLWARGKGKLATLPANVMPAIRSGLQVSRCSKDKTEKPAPAASSTKKGTWSFTQTNTDGSATTPYSSNVKLNFAPEKDNVNCSEIAFVQGVRHVDLTTSASVNPIPTYQSRMAANGWTLDRIAARKYGWYGYNNDGSPGGVVTPGSSPTPLKTAILRDTPTNDIANSSLSFESCAICKSGTDVGTIYGCYTWGFDVDTNRKVTSHANTETTTPSSDFDEVVKNWNTQASGPAAARNDPNQQKLGPFK